MVISRLSRFNWISLLIVFFCNSTYVLSQVSFGIRAGASLQNINGTYENGEKLKNDFVPGFHAGFMMEIPVTPDFYFRPGLLFSTKGSDNVYEISGQKASLYYLELPLHFAFKPHASAGRLVMGLGPYLAYGISGNFLFAGGKEEIVFRNRITPNEQLSGVFYLRPWDAGADVFLEYKFSVGLALRINAQLGLLNLMPATKGESSSALLRNTGYGISLGYWF